MQTRALMPLRNCCCVSVRPCVTDMRLDINRRIPWQCAIYSSVFVCLISCHVYAGTLACVHPLVFQMVSVKECSFPNFVHRIHR